MCVCMRAVKIYRLPYARHSFIIVATISRYYTWPRCRIVYIIFGVPIPTMIYRIVIHHSVNREFNNNYELYGKKQSL